MIAASLNTLAQNTELPLSAFVIDETGKFNEGEWVASQNRCKQFFDKNNKPVVFFVANDPELDTGSGFDKLNDYVSVKSNEWNYTSKNNGIIFFALYLTEDKKVATSWIGYGDFFNNNVLKHKELISKTIKTWYIKDLPEKLIDMLECLYDSKPLLRNGASIEETIYLMAYDNKSNVADLSGLLTNNEMEEISKLCDNIKKNTGRNFKLVTILAPSFNRRNLDDLARRLCDDWPDIQTEIILINEYNCDFATYILPVFDPDGKRKLSTDNYEELKKLLADNSQNTFLRGSLIEIFIKEYGRKTLTAEDKLYTFAEDGIFTGLCCYLPISYVLFKIIVETTIAIQRRRHSPQGAQQEIKKTHQKP